MVNETENGRLDADIIFGVLTDVSKFLDHFGVLATIFTKSPFVDQNEIQFKMNDPVLFSIICPLIFHEIRMKRQRSKSRIEFSLKL